ncbi:copper chaperone PCu(A)C [uncultured Mycolicibacterium sp.]|uniref:copper chaperone PCu(A)C n=1 Tax=uncultured Mycolicibacterium sp. TaxID=2320817 RepID=UPI0026334BEF|nr:copper chaperone PCu(A)C [uncultured Mycolicibacterium sp.]
MLFNHIHRMPRRAFVALAAGALLAAGCTDAAEPQDGPLAERVSVSDAWAKAVDAGMTSVFATFANDGVRDAQLVSAASPVAATVEIHEVVSDGAGGSRMQPKAGGITVPAHGRTELAPGGDHLMLMDLRHPLRPGDEVELTVTFADGSTLPVTAQVRDFAGAQENYSGGADHADHGDHRHADEHTGHHHG